MMTDDDDTNESVKGEVIFSVTYVQYMYTSMLYNNRQNMYSNAIMFSSQCERFLYYYYIFFASTI